MGQSLKCCNVYIRVDICLLFWTLIQDNVDWRGNHHLENIERRLGTINRHPHLSPFFISTIDSIPHGPRSEARNRMKLCWASTTVPVETTNQPRVSLSPCISLFITSLYIYQTDGGWYMVKNGTTTTFSSKLMSAWATDQVPQRARRVFFYFFFKYLNLKELTFSLFYFLNCLCFDFLSDEQLEL